MSKKMKYASMFGVSVLSLGILSGCSSSTNASGLSGVTSAYNKECDDWERQKDGSFKCDDDRSKYRGGYFFNGGYYANHSQMVASSNYKNNNLVNGVKRTSTSSVKSSSKSSSTGKTGIGSGAKGGGAS